MIPLSLGIPYLPYITHMLKPKLLEAQGGIRQVNQTIENKIRAGEFFYT
jgi:hypothetical protein